MDIFSPQMVIDDSNGKNFIVRPGQKTLSIEEVIRQMGNRNIDFWLEFRYVE